MRSSSDNKSSANRTNAIEIVPGSSEYDSIHEMNALQLYTESSDSSKFIINVLIDDKVFRMEFDTGSAISTMSEKLLRAQLPNVQIRPTKIQLKAYNGNIFSALGVVTVSVTYDEKTITGNLYIVDDKLDSIFGREWIKALQLLPPFSIKGIAIDDLFRIENDVCTAYADVFDSSIGTIPNVEGKLKLREGVSPVYVRPRPVPYAIRHLVEEEIARLERSGTLEKVEHSDWGTPVVPIIKSDDQIRLCADYKVTLNKVIHDDKYPIPKIEDMMQNFDGAKYFCVFDIHKAYLHMPMDEESAVMQTISTHKGLYKVRKLMFGVKTAPNIWQRFMDQYITNGLSGTQCFFDDIIVAGRTLPETVERVHELVKKLRRYNLHLNKNKCKLFRESVEYLGYTISKDGLRKNADKTNSIVAIRPPNDVSDLRQFIGMVAFYGNFIPDMATRLHPLYNLLHDDVQFNWNESCQKSFADIKEELLSDRVLMPYSESLPLILATDASPVGISAILSHQTPAGERPIAYASRTLSKSELNYSQLHKEATAIFWAVRKFFNYCYGREFTLITDNKPLALIFDSEKCLPTLTAQRLLNYAQFLSGFKYKIIHREAKNHTNVDFLSRHPVVETDRPDDREEFTVCQLSENVMPVTNATISKAMKTDGGLCDLFNRLQTGDNLSGTPYKGQEAELTLQGGCIYKGIRIIIPISLRRRILDELHTAHIGIVKMKALARSYCYWIGIDFDIETVVKECRDCARVANEPTKIPVHPWEAPTMPWQRIHIDFAGPFMEHYFMIVVDATSKWIEVVPMKTITSFYTIRALREIFARFGLPSIVVTDNGTNFVSREFQDFLQSNGIVHKRTAPAHPSTNGQAERTVQSFKVALRAAMNDSGDLHLKLQRFLLQYRKVPNSSTGKSPAEIMLRINPRSLIDLIKPTQRVIEYTNTLPSNHSGREFNVGDTVQIRWYQNKVCKWKFGKVVRRDGMLHYWIDIDGKLQRRHIDQIRFTLVVGNHDGFAPNIQRKIETNGTPIVEQFIQASSDGAVNDSNSNVINPNDSVSLAPPSTSTPMTRNNQQSVSGNADISCDLPNVSVGCEASKERPGISPPVFRRSRRVRRPPNKLDL